MNLEKLNASKIAAVTKHDSNPLAFDAFALYIGTGGTLTVTTPDGYTAQFTNVANGTIIPVKARYVLSTGTSSTDIVALA